VERHAPAVTEVAALVGVQGVVGAKYRKRQTADVGRQILEGEVEMSISSKDNNSDNFSGIVKADSFFGNVDYLLSENRAITVKAKTDVSLFAISTSLLDTIIKYDSGLDRKLIEHMSRRLKRQSFISNN
jgi:CRP-like cAMP-binding protein